MLVSNIATFWQDLLSCSPARLSKVTLSFSAADSLLGLLSLTTPAVDWGSTLNASNYLSVSHNHLPENEVDIESGHSVFLIAHRTAPGSSGHFWFLQVGITYLPDQDLKTTMLLGLSTLVDIYPDKGDRFKLHPLKESSTHPALTNNKVEDGFVKWHSTWVLLLTTCMWVSKSTQIQTIIWCLDKCSHNYILCEYDYLNGTPRAKAAQGH
jgi:hypothetical protein